MNDINSKLDELKEISNINLHKYSKEEIFDKSLTSLIEMYNYSTIIFNNITDIISEVMSLNNNIVNKIKNDVSLSIEYSDHIKLLNEISSNLLDKYKDVFHLNKIIIEYINDVKSKDLESEIDDSNI